MDFGYYRGSSEPTRGLVIKSQANATLVTFLDSGKVGIGTTSPSYDLEVNGEISATNKSFVIDHPTKPNMKLRYGSLEGP